jgi:hypothetical protein
MRIAGLQKYGASLGSQILINGQAFTVAQLLAIYQACVADRSQVASARGALRVLVLQQQKDDAAKGAIDQGLKVALVAKYGPNSQEVSDFGYVKQPKKATAAVKALAVDQSAVTRKARHIMGKVQRAAIKPPLAAQATLEPTSPAPGSTTPVKA